MQYEIPLRIAQRRKEILRRFRRFAQIKRRILLNFYLRKSAKSADMLHLIICVHLCPICG
jgi:hypothetical protein